VRRPGLPRSRRGQVAVLAGVVAVLGGLALGGYLYVKGRTGSVFPRPHAPFVKEPPAKKPAKPPVAKFVWPVYGYTPMHRRYFDAPATMRPPFRKVWETKETGLLEFPPTMSGERIFQLADNGVLSAIDKETGRILWREKVGVLSASTPAIYSGTLYATVLSRPNDGNGGRIVAVKTGTGGVEWSRSLPSRSESSPIVNKGKVIFGSEAGTVYALNAHNGRTIWTYQAAGAVKASPTLYKGILYFGDYAGDVQAISERTGRRIWVSGSEGEAIGSGTFYSTAAIAYGRVYLGNTDGRIYAYEAKTGKLDWAIQTGAYVYGSPAVADAPRIGPTIYEGSYDGTLYAINARSGRIEWRHVASGPISGSATIIGEVVYFSNLKTYMTTGLDISTGKVLFEIREGAFDPVISDGDRLYLTAYSTLFAFEPLDEHNKTTTNPTKTGATKTGATKITATKTQATKTTATKTTATKTQATKTQATKTGATKTTATKTGATAKRSTKTAAAIGVSTGGRHATALRGRLSGRSGLRCGSCRRGAPARSSTPRRRARSSRRRR
jgi:outer membrane protein assembly factor BamB